MPKNKPHLAIITTHPIQYYAPWFAMLAKRNILKIKVFYTWQQSSEQLFDSGFEKTVEWDIPLLADYEYEFVRNTSSNHGLSSYGGIKTPDLTKKIETWKADAILVFGWNYHSHFTAMRYFKRKIPVYFRGDSHLLDEISGLRKIARRLWLRYVYRFVDYAMYVGQNNKHYYQKHGLKDSALFFAPHAIDNNRFNKISKEQNQEILDWQNQIGLQKERQTVLFVGKLEPKKNPEIMLKIAAMENFSDINFLMVGNGKLETYLKQSAKNLPNVFFLPFQNQSKMPLVYRLGDVFVLPSDGPNETWGLAINEAMACGLPVVASTKVGCSVDLVDEKNGGIFHAGSEIDLAEILLRLTKNKNLKKLGTKSQQRIKKWSFKEICQVIENQLNK